MSATTERESRREARNVSRCLSVYTSVVQLHQRPLSTSSASSQPSVLSCLQAPLLPQDALVLLSNTKLKSPVRNSVTHVFRLSVIAAACVSGRVMNPFLLNDW